MKHVIDDEMVRRGHDVLARVGIIYGDQHHVVREMLEAALSPPLRRFSDTPREDRRVASAGAYAPYEGSANTDAAAESWAKAADQAYREHKSRGVEGRAPSGAEDKFYNMGKVTGMTAGLAPNAPRTFRTDGAQSAAKPTPEPTEIHVSKAMLKAADQILRAAGLRSLHNCIWFEDVNVERLYQAMHLKHMEETGQGAGNSCFT